MYYMAEDKDTRHIRYFKDTVIIEKQLDEKGVGVIITKGGYSFKCIGVIDDDLAEASKQYYEDKAYYEQVIRGLTSSIKTKAADGKTKAADIKALMKLRDDTIEELKTLNGKIVDEEVSEDETE
ncbi:hypothetical protein BCU90_17445 [Vibrio lentus]|uniref:hypothetical protein n=1 Tax=Vibrio lentus TaxID=136468 RepID=UPI000C83AD03|nr:hypothetical protein [Vibrio lentus]PMG45649.1 hypothetical protein BCU90_17445 [Vibrio lentus]